MVLRHSALLTELIECRRTYETWLFRLPQQVLAVSQMAIRGFKNGV